MEERQLDVDKYTKVLGSGGFGLVVYNPLDNIVMKLIYKDSQCQEASVESGYHKQVYEKVKEWLKNHPLDQIDVIKPHGFRDQAIVWNDQYFRCSYVMDLIKPIPGFSTLVHIILKEENKQLFNKELGRISTQPVSNTNPSRGFFATCEYITENILTKVNSNMITSCDELARLLGILFGISIFGAKIIPKDAEYVLSYKNNQLTVTMLDFGMFIPLDLSKPLDKYVSIIKYEVMEQDIYFPYQSIEGISDSQEPELFKHLAHGIKETANYYISHTSNAREKQSLEYILDRIISEEEEYSPQIISPLVINIEKLTLTNPQFRKILKTNKHSQLVLMSLKPREEIGSEIHKNVDQFIRIEKGTGVAVLAGTRYKITDGSAIIVPAGTEHNIINTSSRNTLKLYTIYSPPEHPSDV